MLRIQKKLEAFAISVALARSIPKESPNQLLNLPHHCRAGSEPFGPAQFPEFGRGSHIDPPDERSILIANLDRPELIKSDDGVNPATRIILEICGLPTVSGGFPVAGRQA